MNLLGKTNILDTVSSSVQPISDICRQTVIDARKGILEDAVKARIEAVREYVAIILQARAELRDHQNEIFLLVRISEVRYSTSEINNGTKE